MNIKQLGIVFLAIVLALVSFSPVLAHHYDSDDNEERAAYYGPIYQTGYYYETHSYGYSGWDYNRVYYRYHYPYSNYRYNNYYPPGTWVAHYAHRVYPAMGGYPFPGYYW